MVDDRLSLVWGFPFFIVFIRVALVDDRLLLVWGSLRLAPIKIVDIVSHSPSIYITLTSYLQVYKYISS